MSTPGLAPRAGDAPRRKLLRSLDPRWITVVLLAVSTVVVGVMLTHYAFRAWNHTLDEDIYRNLGLWTADHLPSGLWHVNAGISDRGIQRLEGWVLAIGLGGFGSPDGYKITKIINIALFCSTVVPVWMWSRRMGVGVVMAGLAAALAIIVPWAVITSTYFTENVAYPAATWALFAAWCAAVRLTPRSLILAALAALLAATGRSVLMVIAVVMVVTIYAVGLRFGAREAWRTRAQWRMWQVAPWAVLGLAVIVSICLLAFDRSAFAPLTGVYSTSLGIGWSLVPNLAQRVMANLISGSGIVPGILAVAWVARSLWRPQRRESFALAIIAVGTALLMIYSAMRGGADERYTMFLAPVIMVCAATAVSRREVGVVAVAIATGVAVWLFSSVEWTQTSVAYGFFINSAEAFHGRILLLGIGSRVPDVGLSYAAVLAIGIVAAMAVAAWALRSRRRAALIVGGLLAVGVLGLQLAQTSYVVRHFTAEAAFGGPTLAAHTWVDTALGRDHGAGLFVDQSGPEPALREAWREVSFWNLSVDQVFLGPRAPALPGYVNPVYHVEIDHEDGHLISPVPIPDDLVEARQAPISPLVGRQLAVTYEPMALMRIARPARVMWLMSGSDEQGMTRVDRPTRMRVFRAGGTGDCLSLILEGPPGLVGTRTVEVRSGKDVKRVKVEAIKGTEMERVPLHVANATRFEDITVRALGSNVRPDGERRGARIAGAGRVSCAKG